MPDTLNLIAIDLGASGGRVTLARLCAGCLTLCEIYRFDHRPVHLPHVTPTGAYCWDAPALWGQVKRGIGLAAQATDHIHGIGIDAWGVDYALLDKSGQLVRPPIAYRDPRTEATFEPVIQQLGRQAIYDRTGIQFMPINTLYQLAADAVDPARPLTRAAVMLMIPQVLSYWLTGRQVAEHTMASTTQIYDSQTRQWAIEFADALGIPRNIFPEVVDAGTIIGPLLPAVADELHLPAATPVIAVGSHDTASAVAATPLANEESAYLSSGTWSLVGVELKSPMRTPAALAANLTNEAGIAGSTRLLKNVNGMWLIQECRRTWLEAGPEEGGQFTNEQLVQQAAAQPPGSIIDPNHPSFAAPGDMPARIRVACEEANQPIPQNPAAIIRCIIDSLASSYARVLKTLAHATDRKITKLNIVGGGAHNQLLNRLTAEATGCEIIVGPHEATCIGNALVQAMALGAIKDLAEARKIVRDSLGSV
jgi:rhamnulokinase